MHDSILQYVVQPIIAGVFAVLVVILPVYMKDFLERKKTRLPRAKSDHVRSVRNDLEHTPTQPRNVTHGATFVVIATSAILLDLFSVALAISAIHAGFGARKLTGLCAAATGATALVLAILLNLRASRLDNQHVGFIERKPPPMKTNLMILSIGAVAGVSLCLGLLGTGIDSVHVYAGSGPVPLKTPVTVTAYYSPFYMGDDDKHLADHIRMNSQFTVNCHPDPTCMKFEFVPGKSSWAGVYWLPQGTGPASWGDHPGRKIESVQKLVFWARGESGTELVKFQVGGVESGKYHDSLDVVMDPNPLPLTVQWQRYEIDLKSA